MCARCRAHFRQALSREPTLIEAAEGIASLSGAELTTSGTGSVRGSWERLRDAAKAVLRIDGQSAIGHSALGAVYAGFDYDWSGAEAELQAALASPSPGADAQLPRNSASDRNAEPGAQGSSTSCKCSANVGGSQATSSRRVCSASEYRQRRSGEQSRQYGFR
jgi:hypothetical protein